MNLEIKCESCGTKLLVDSALVNHQVQCSNCQETFTVPLTAFVSGMVCGAYWLQKKLGSGDIADIFLAKRLSDNKKFFLKILSPCVTPNHAVVEQYLIEACRSHQIQHENLITVEETGKIQNHYYLATPAVSGECLDKRIQRAGPLAEKEALKILLKIARILRYCWEDFRIVHGALSPGNILLSDSGDVYLLDMGSLKQLLITPEVPIERLNNRGTLADFWSPEHIQGLPLDAKSDIYCMGAVLFYLLTGTKPYPGPDLGTILQRHLNGPVPDPRSRPGNVGPESAELILRMLNPLPDQRLASWGEVITYTKKIIETKTRGTGTEAILRTQLHRLPSSSKLDSTPAEAVDSISPSPPPQETSRIVRWIVGVGVSLVIILAGAMYAVVMWKKQKPLPTKETSTPSGSEVASGLPEALFEQRLKNLHTYFRNNPTSFDFTIAALEKLRSEIVDPSQIARVEAAIEKVQLAKQQHEEATMAKMEANLSIDEVYLRCEGEQLLKNTGFESRLEHWNIYEGDAEITFKVQYVQKGDKAVLLKSDRGLIGQTISPVQEGKDYSLTFYGMLLKKVPGYGGIDFFDQNGSRIGGTLVQIKSTRFQLHELTVAAPPGSHQALVWFYCGEQPSERFEWLKKDKKEESSQSLTTPTTPSSPQPPPSSPPKAKSIEYAFKPGKESYLRTVYALGPFGKDDPLNEIVSPSLAGVPNVDQKFMFRSREYSWQLVDIRNQAHTNLTLTNAFQGESPAGKKAILFVVLKASKEENVRFFIGHDDGLVLYLNGKEIYKNIAAVAKDKGTASGTLQKGNNLLLMYTDNVFGDWWVSCSIKDAQSGNPPKDLKLFLPGKN